MRRFGITLPNGRGSDRSRARAELRAAGGSDRSRARQQAFAFRALEVK